MPRFYFHIRRGQVTILDQTGVELNNRWEAAAHGQWLAQRETPLSSSRTIFVEDEFGIIFEFPPNDQWAAREGKAAS
jgi:hypothetical protein